MRSPTKILALSSLILLFTGVLGVSRNARAQSDENRHVLRARHFDEADVSDEYAKLAEEKTLESIKFLKDLIAQGNATGDRKAEMELRLADLYYQEGRSIYLREMKAYDAAYDKCFNTVGCNTDAMKPDTSGSKQWQVKSIALYHDILMHYPRYARADEAIYYMGAAQMDLGRKDDGVQDFIKLVKLYPDSSFVPDAYVQIGEYYFDHNNAYKALLAYKKATAYRDADKYGFAMYKLAWCYYNVGEYGKSIDTMKAVVSYSQAQAQQASGSRLQLGQEALKDLVRFFADAGEMDEAYAYFNQLGKKELIHAMLMRLAKTYMEQGKWQQAVQTYRRLIAEDPQSPKDPDYQHQIVQAYRKMGDSEGTFTEIDRALKTYGTNSAWARANSSDTETVKSANAEIEHDLLQVATEHQQRGRKLAGAEQAASFDLAGRAYAVYLDTYPKSEHAYDVQYQYAELLYHTKQYAKAYDHYVAAVKMDPKGAHSRFCAESAIFATEQMIKQEQAQNPQPKTKGTEAVPLTDWEKKLVASCDQYAKLYPDDSKVKNIIYKSAYLLYHKEHLEEAADRFREVIKMDPTSTEAEEAAHLILDSFVQKKDWTNLEKNAKFFYEQKDLGSSKFKSEVFEIYQNASIKLIEVAFAKDKDYGKAADAYMQFVKDFPNYDEMARVLNNAALYYRKAGRVGDSMKVRHILVEDPRFGPKTKYYYTQVGALGYDYETIADFKDATHYYELLFSLYPKERVKEVRGKTDADTLGKLDQAAADAIYSAAVFQKALGNWQTSIADYKQLVATFPKDPRDDDVQIRIATIYEEQKDYAQAGTVFYNYYTRAGKDHMDLAYYARLHYAKALLKQHQDTRAKKVFEETVALYKRFIAGGGKTGPYTDYVAEMMFDLAKPTYDDYAAKKITGCRCQSRAREDRTLGDNLKAKAKGLLDVEQAYTAIIKTGSGHWGLAALVQLGRAYENMGNALKKSDVPFYLTPDQRDIYTMRIQDKVYPQTQKAISTYKAAMQKSWQLTLYDDDTAYATRRLGKLAPDDFPGLEEKVPVPLLTSHTIPTYNYATEL